MKVLSIFLLLALESLVSAYPKGAKDGAKSKKIESATTSKEKDAKPKGAKSKGGKGIGKNRSKSAQTSTTYTKVEPTPTEPPPPLKPIPINSKVTENENLEQGTKPISENQESCDSSENEESNSDPSDESRAFIGKNRPSVLIGVGARRPCDPESVPETSDPETPPHAEETEYPKPVAISKGVRVINSRKH